MVNTSASRDAGYQSILDPRPSTAKTSISIPSVLQTKQEKVRNATRHLSRLELASNYLTPVIDEIIGRATSYTQNEFRQLLQTKSPICAISMTQFSRACKASEIISEVQDYPVPEYVVNTATHTNDDRIYIDRDLLKQLVDLQNMILETIKKLKDSSEDMHVEDVKGDLEENFVIIDERGEEVKRLPERNPAGIQTLTVNVDKHLKDPKGFENVSEMTAQLPTFSDLCVPLDNEPVTEEEDTDSELITKTEINDAENVLVVPDPIYEKAVEMCDCSAENLAESVDEKCRADITRFRGELEKVKCMLNQLRDEVETLKRGKVGKDVVPSNGNNEAPDDLENEILECLKELRQIKDALGRMNNPDLTLDTAQKDGGRPCCELRDVPHVHAKLNGIPVIIKLNESSIDIILSDNDKHKEKLDDDQERKCACRAIKQQDAVVIAKIRSTIHTKINSIPYPYNTEVEENIVVKKKPKSVVQSAFTNHCIDGSDLDDRESITGLPYTVHKQSLPSVNICPAMNINVNQLKRGMRSSDIQHPKIRIKNQLAAVGVDNLIKASIPAECCRKAVINEAERDDEPFHASINSLPLTTSDIQIIAENCTPFTKTPCPTKFEYYTNFQENLASNIDYYMPKSRVYEVRFFRIFRKDEQKKSGLGERLSEVLRRIIFSDVNAAGARANGSEQPPPKLKRNKKCQTDEQGSVYKPSVDSLPHHSRTSKTKRAKGKNSSRISSHSVQCSITEEQHANKSKSKQKTKTKHLRKPLTEIPLKGTQMLNSNQSIFACNTNLGTIYESEERHHGKKIKERSGKNMESFYDFMRSPSISESFQRFLASEATLKALERSNMDSEQFWELYFEAKKSHKSVSCDKRSFDKCNLAKRVGSSTSQLRRRHGKYRRSSVSKIPKRIVKHTFSSTSSDVSTARKKKKLKTQEIAEKNDLVVKVKPKPPETPVEKKSKIPTTPSTLSLLEIANKYNSEDKAKIFFNENMRDTPSSDFKDNSLESLQLLASKNGPGYITVLHPICGCPEVSIFIPCYCAAASKNVMSQQTVQKLVCKNDGRHIVLPKGCRVEKYEGEDSNGQVKRD